MLSQEHSGCGEEASAEGEVSAFGSQGLQVIVSDSRKVEERVSTLKEYQPSKRGKQHHASAVLVTCAALFIALIVSHVHQGAQPSKAKSPTVTRIELSLSRHLACSKFPAPPPLPGKKGAAFTLRDKGQSGSWIENIPKILLLKPYWNYSWGSKRVDAQPKNIEFVPMIWGGYNAANLQQNLVDNVTPQIKSGKVKRLLGFNEPDNPKQSNMPVQLALDRWTLLESVNLPLVSPSCVQPSGEWMSTFMANATEICKRVDWVGVHWYGGANFATFVDRMTEYHVRYGRPILITEFAPADWSATTVDNNRFSRAAVLAFMKQALPWLEAQAWIAGYAWFSFDITSPAGTSSALFDQQGNLTACGRYYASVRTSRPKGNQNITA